MVTRSALGTCIGRNSPVQESRRSHRFNRHPEWSLTSAGRALLDARSKAMHGQGNEGIACRCFPVNIPSGNALKTSCFFWRKTGRWR